jgi:hypothetical protein
MAMKMHRTLLIVLILSCMLINIAHTTANRFFATHNNCIVSALVTQSPILNFLLCATLPLKLVSYYYLEQQSAANKADPQPHDSDTAHDTTAASTGIMGQQSSPLKFSLCKTRIPACLAAGVAYAGHQFMPCFRETLLSRHQGYFLTALIILLLLPHRLRYSDSRCNLLVRCFRAQSGRTDWVFYLVNPTCGGLL